MQGFKQILSWQYVQSSWCLWILYSSVLDQTPHWCFCPYIPILKIGSSIDNVRFSWGNLLCFVDGCLIEFQSLSIKSDISLWILFAVLHGFTQLFIVYETFLLFRHCHLPFNWKLYRENLLLYDRHNLPCIFPDYSQLCNRYFRQKEILWWLLEILEWFGSS